LSAVERAELEQKLRASQTRKKRRGR
jgi:hypothetical protein